MNRRSALLALAASALCAPTRASAQLPGNVLLVGPGRALRTVKEAAQRARDGDVIEIEAGDYRGDVAVWPAGRLTIRGVGGRPRIIADGAAAESKGIWVFRGGEITIENVELTGARVPDRNGAGIRLESGRLRIARSRVLDNEMSILTSNDPAIELHVERCELTGPAENAGGVTHALYAGTIGRLVVEGCYVHHGNVGHLIKSRARESVIAFNRLTDESGSASYELEFPNGGNAYVVGNLIQQSIHTQNQTMIAFGAEGYRWPDSALRMWHNTLVNDLGDAGILYAAQPGDIRVWARYNLIVGGGKRNVPANADLASDFEVLRTSFAAPSQFDYRLRASHPLARSLKPLVVEQGAPIALTREYRHPADWHELARLARVTPGAFQELAE